MNQFVPGNTDDHDGVVYIPWLVEKVNPSTNEVEEVAICIAPHATGAKVQCGYNISATNVNARPLDPWVDQGLVVKQNHKRSLNDYAQ